MGRREVPGTSLLVRNLSKNARIEDLRYAAEKYGRVRDVYIPRDYYTGEPRGIGFIEYSDPRDAEDAKFGLDRRMIEGREGRKRPDEYRAIATGRRRGSPRGRSRSPRRRMDSPRRRKRSYTPSRSPSRSRSRTPRSASPPARKPSASRSPTGSPPASPEANVKSPSRSRSRSRSRSPSKWLLTKNKKKKKKSALEDGPYD